MYAGECLSLGGTWEGSLGKVAAAANRTREIRLYGMRRGLAESWAMVELGTRRTTERVRDGNSLPTGACAVFLPDSLPIAYLLNGCRRKKNS